MKSAPMPENEKERLEAVHKLAILDTESEVRFDDMTKEAVEKLKVPISTITILDSKREWFKSYQGLSEREGERAISFCGHALLAKNIFFVEDTLKDPRFADNPMVIGYPFIRFYGGIALIDHKSGQYVGVFCIKDTKPRTLNVEEVEIFIDLADRAEMELNK
ncbi:MAG: GAF domain-containing protein [Candidatus Zambryskibacteria bacterium]